MKFPSDPSRLSYQWFQGESWGFNPVDSFGANRYRYPPDNSITICGFRTYRGAR